MFAKIISFLGFVATASAQELSIIDRPKVRVVSTSDELTFLPSNANSPTSINDGGSPTSGELSGNRFIQNGALYDSGDVTVNSGVLVGSAMPQPDFFYTSKCTATDGINGSGSSPPVVKENLCQYNLCFGWDGCIFARSGGPFDLAPEDQNTDAVPDVKINILGGTGIYEGFSGEGLVSTISVPGDNFDGEAVLEVTLPFTFPSPFP